MRRLVVLVVVLAVAAGAAVPAQAAAPGAAAERFAGAVARARTALTALRPQFQEAYAGLDLPLCRGAIAHAPVEDAFTVLFVVSIVASKPITELGAAPLQTMIADLDAVTTRDRVLRSGRAAWRNTIAAMDRFPQLDRPCEALDAWRRSGWKDSAAPPIVIPPDLPPTRTADRKLAAAAQRLRALGVPAARAQAFDGRHLFDGLVPGDVFDDLL